MLLSDHQAAALFTVGWSGVLQNLSYHLLPLIYGRGSEMNGPDGTKRSIRPTMLADLIGGAIVDGTYVGVLPREGDLAAMHKVGRSAVREALKMLMAKGLIQSSPRRGTVVRPRRHWSMFDPDVQAWLRQSPPDPILLSEMKEFRQVIETGIIALASQHATVDDRESLRRAINAVKTSAPGNERLSASIALARVLLEATHNSFIVSTAPSVITARAIEAQEQPAESLADLLGAAQTVLDGGPCHAPAAMTPSRP